MPESNGGGPPGHDIVVIGASAGGVVTLINIVRELPDDLRAAVFVTVHVPAAVTSNLPRVLTRASPLPAVHSIDGDPIRCGRIYVAPPNQHLLVGRSQVRLSRGPRENGLRPAIDPLFRSAARHHGPRVIGVVLSGLLADGSMGLREVRRHGGVAIVQDPADALFGDMPTNAMEIAEPDHVVTAGEIPALLQRLIAPTAPAIDLEETSGMTDEDLVTEDWRLDSPPGSDDAPGTPTGYSCPECHGVLWEITEGEEDGYRCRTGHRLSLESLVELKDNEAEGALYGALRALEEKASARRRLAERMRARGAASVATRFDEDARSTQRQVTILRRVVDAMTAPPALEA
jgi:two-component system, chemotaxis family, protein-glutamate methylesterase/glutaminase